MYIYMYNFIYVYMDLKFRHLLLKGRTLTATFTEAMADNNLIAWTIITFFFFITCSLAK